MNHPTPCQVNVFYFCNVLRASPLIGSQVFSAAHSLTQSFLKMVLRQGRSRLWAAAFLAVLVPAAIVWNSEASATELTLGSKCFDVRLLGGMVDSFDCKKVAVRLQEQNCADKLVISNQRVMADLSQCTTTTARAKVNVSATESLDFEVYQLPNSANEVWAIRSKGLPAPAIAAVKKEPTEPRPPKEEPGPPPPSPIADVSEDLTRWLDGFVDFSVNANLLHANSKSRKLSNAIGTDKASYSLRDELANGGQLLQAELGSLILNQDQYESRFVLGIGSGAQNWRRSPYHEESTAGEVGLQEISFTHKGRFARVSVGRTAIGYSQGLVPQLRDLSLGRQYLAPHYNTGVSAILFPQAKVKPYLFLGTGWDREVGAADTPSMGLGAAYQSSSIFLGAQYVKAFENGSRGNTKISGDMTSMKGFAGLTLFERLKLQLTITQLSLTVPGSGTSKLTRSLSSLEFSSLYMFSPKNSLWLELENFEHDEGVLFADLSTKNLYRGALSWVHLPMRRIQTFFGVRGLMMNTAVTNLVKADDQYHFFAQLRWTL